MKQETKLVAIILAALIVFLSGFGLGATKGINIKIEGAAVQTGGQAAAPVDSYVSPEPYAMPGYADEVIMAAGAFVGGATSELSADGPLKAPYAVYFQGGLTWQHAKFGILMSLQKLKDAGLPAVVYEQTPWYAKRATIPVVKAKIGPKIMTMLADEKAFAQLPLKTEAKVVISGLYITDVKSARGGLIPLPKKKTIGQRITGIFKKDK